MATRKVRALFGTEIVTQDGRDLGEVRDIELDLESWRVVSIEVDLDRDVLEALGMKRPLIGSQTLALGPDRVSGVTDKLVLRETFDALAERVRSTPELTAPAPSEPEDS